MKQSILPMTTTNSSSSSSPDEAPSTSTTASSSFSSSAAAAAVGRSEERSDMEVQQQQQQQQQSDELWKALEEFRNQEMANTLARSSSKSNFMELQEKVIDVSGPVPPRVFKYILIAMGLCGILVGIILGAIIGQRILAAAAMEEQKPIHHGSTTILSSDAPSGVVNIGYPPTYTSYPTIAPISQPSIIVLQPPSQPSIFNGISESPSNSVSEAPSTITTTTTDATNTTTATTAPSTTP